MRYLMIAVLCAPLCWLCPSRVMGEAYKLAMLPLHGPEAVLARITPLAVYLSRETGVDIDPVAHRDYDAYERAVLSGDLVLGYENPSVYVRISGVHEAVALAEDKIGGTRFRGLIITRSDSALKTLEDLRGKRISIVGRTSAGGYLSPRLALKKAGIDPEKDCRVMEAAGNTQENVIFSVHIGEADAGFIRESALNMANAYIPSGSIRVLAEGEWIPNYCFSVRRDLPEPLKKRIREALFSLKPGDPVLESLQIRGWQPASEGLFEGIR